MASTVTELLRRRFNGGPKVKNFAFGSITLSEDSSLIEIEHNFNSAHYMVAVRNTNPRYGVDGVMYAVLVVGVSKYNTLINGVTRNTINCISESRSGTEQYYNNTSASFATLADQNALPNSCCVYCRTSAYKFIGGDTFEWIAVNFEKADFDKEETLTEGQNSITFNNPLNTENLFCCLEKDVPILQGNAANAIYVCRFFVSSGIGHINIESRSSISTDTTTIAFGGTDSISSSSITIGGRSSVYNLKAGDYEFKAVKIEI